MKQKTMDRIHPARSRFVWIVLCIVSCGVAAIGQDAGVRPEADTAGRHMNFLLPGLSGIQTPMIVPEFFSTGYGPTPGFVVPALDITQPHRFGSYRENLDLTAGWRLELAGQEKLKTLQIIMGAAVLGGAGYVAYEHVKKYGF
jgi:hypothetical protein